ncbi:MAG: hypothetical protein AAFR83_23260 [Cyanobacteria bacterium J06629_18]
MENKKENKAKSNNKPKECSQCSINWRPNCQEIAQMRQQNVGRLEREGFNRKAFKKPKNDDNKNKKK